jgi:hypothetical protein
MKSKRSARELEINAAKAGWKPVLSNTPPESEVMAMLVRRGLQPSKTASNTPFPQPLSDELASKLSHWLGHYAFRLFLRGAIKKSKSFLPRETTSYLVQTQSGHYCKVLVDLGLAEKLTHGRYKLKMAASSFGGTLEWYVGHELERRFGFEVETGIKLHARGVGGDLDVVAAAEGKLIYLELKSSPPKNISTGEVGAFCDRLFLLNPDLTLFVVDTALRLTDKILPMLMDEFQHRQYSLPSKPKRIAAQLWALTPRIYVVNGSRDLMANIGKAIASGLRALSGSPIESV